MLFSILSGGDWRDIVINLLLTLPVILLALSFHEAAHAFAAYKMGDRTAYNLGRVTLNPAKHLDLFGTLSMLIVGYGWAKPVPINARNFRNPKMGMAITAIAGPLANLALGLLGTIFCAITSVAMTLNLFTLLENDMLFRIVDIIFTLFYYMGVMNFILMFFNLIPVPPFDGSRFFGMFLPDKLYFDIMRYERYILLAVLLGSVVCSNLFDFSPFGWLGTKFFELIFNPIAELLFNIFM